MLFSDSGEVPNKKTNVVRGDRFFVEGKPTLFQFGQPALTLLIEMDYAYHDLVGGSL